jgi:N-acylglucosamine 2-epimerase
VLAEYRDEWQKDLFERVVPFWSKHSLDTVHGGYLTALDKDGSVYDTTK